MVIQGRAGGGVGSVIKVCSGVYEGIVQWGV